MSHPTSRRAPVRSSYIGPGTSNVTNAIREASSPGSTESNDNKTDQNRAGSNVSPSKRTIKRKMVNYEELAMLSTTEKEKKPVEIEIQEGKVQSIVEELSRSAESPPKEPIHYSPPLKQMQVTRQPSIQSTSSESSTAASVSSNAPVFASPLPPRVTTRKALDPTTVPPPVSRPPIHTDDVVHKPPTNNIGRENIGNFGLGMTGANDRPTRARTATSKAEDVSHTVTGIVVGAGMAAKSLFHEAKNFFEDMAANPVEREEDIEKRMHQVAIDAQYEANVSMQELIEKYKRLRKETDSTYNELKTYQAKVKTVEKDKEKEIRDQKQRIHKLENTISTTVTDLKTQHQQKIIDVTKLAEETVNKNRALAEQLRGWGITPVTEIPNAMDKFSWWVDINERRKEIETQSIQIESLQFHHLCQLDSLTQRLQETTDAIARCIEKIPRGVRIVDNESDALVEGITAENVLREWEERQKAEAEEEAEEASRQENQEPIEGKSNDDKGDFDKSTAIPKEIDINSSANYKSTKATSRVAIHTNSSISQPAYAEKIEKIPCPVPAEVTQQSTSIPKKDSGIILADDAGRISPTDSTLNVPDNNAAADGVKRKDLLTTKPPIVSKAKQVDSKRTAVSAEVKPVEPEKPEIARTLDVKESTKPISATSTNSVRDISKVTSDNTTAKINSVKLDFDTPALSLDDGDLQSSLLSILDTF